jgi:tRNA-specific 2-thiouridylase
MCNKEIKFGVFYRYAMSEGADAIATGHYRSGEKDQSYFLWAVPKEILSKTIFPVGEMDKNEVRNLAKKFNLPVSEKKDSQGICFLGAVSVKEFLQSELGNDNPALLYTLGQRVSQDGLPDVAGAESGPWYVVGKNVEEKKVILSKTRESSTREIIFTDENWLDEQSKITKAQCRYRGPHISGIIEGNRFVASETFPDIPAPGQSVVFYSGNELAGGGIINE